MLGIIAHYIVSFYSVILVPLLLLHIVWFLADFLFYICLFVCLCISLWMILTQVTCFDRHSFLVVCWVFPYIRVFVYITLVAINYWLISRQLLEESTDVPLSCKTTKIAVFCILTWFIAIYIVFDFVQINDNNENIRYSRCSESIPGRFVQLNTST